MYHSAELKPDADRGRAFGTIRTVSFSRPCTLIIGDIVRSSRFKSRVRNQRYLQALVSRIPRASPLVAVTGVRIASETSAISIS
jgi:hypothetical protein